MTLTNFLVKSYTLTSKTGIFDLPIVKKPFSWVYFRYKRHVEDPFYPILKAYPRLLGDGDIIDVGANIGYTSVLFSEFSQTKQIIHAFEPDSKNFEQLKDNLKSRRLTDRVHLSPVALGDREGNCTFWHADTHPADHRVATDDFKLGREDNECAMFSEVPVTSLDIFANKQKIIDSISFVKMDVQGYEIPVLKGMKEVIAKNPRLVLAVEYCPKDLISLGFDPEQLLGELRSYSFDLFVFESPRLNRLSPSRLSELIEKRGYCDLICARESVESYRAPH